APAGAGHAIGDPISVAVEGELRLFTALPTPGGPEVGEYQEVSVVTATGVKISVPNEIAAGVPAGADVRIEIDVLPEVVAELGAADSATLSDLIAQAAGGKPVEANTPGADQLLEAIARVQEPSARSLELLAAPDPPTPSTEDFRRVFDIAVTDTPDGTSAHLTDQYVTELLGTIQSFYRDGTFKPWTLQTDGLIRHIAWPGDMCDNQDQAGLAAAAAFGHASSDDYFALAGRVLLVLGPKATNCSWTGTASGGGSPDRGGVIALRIPAGDTDAEAEVTSTFTHTALAHEFGHTLGFQHARVRVCDAAAGSEIGDWNESAQQACRWDRTLDYGDPWSVMGNNFPPVYVNALNRYRIGLLDPSEYTVINSAVIDEEVTLTALPQTTPGGVIVALIEDPTGAETLAVEHRIDASPRGNGIRLLTLDRDGGTTLLTPAGVDERPLEPGESYSTNTGVRVETVSANDSTATIRITRPADRPRGITSTSPQSLVLGAAVGSIARFRVDSHSAIKPGQGIGDPYPSTWRACLSPSWVHVSPGYGDDGAGAVTATVNQANPSTDSREGEILLTRGTDLNCDVSEFSRIPVHQMGAAEPAPTLTLTPPSLSLGGDSDLSGSVVVTTNQGPWRAVGYPGWLSVSPPTGQGGASVTIHAAQTVRRAARTATVEFTTEYGAHATLAVTQGAGSGASATALWEVDPSGAGESTYWQAPAASIGGGPVTAHVTITATDGWWAATGMPWWVTVTPSSGVSGTMATVSMLPNFSSAARHPNVAVLTSTKALAPLAMAQDPWPSSAPALGLSESAVTFDASYLLTHRVWLSTNQPSWTVDPGLPSWLSVTRSNPLVDQDSFLTLRAQENTGQSPRNGTVVVRAGGATATLNVTQAGTVATVSIGSVSVSGSAVVGEVLAAQANG
ncbi:MAG: hypothetical protein LBT54_05385, partial [Bifidobacteriaceae bacterium]|nr:hypothetical protein [Bifidobacteriaceae bacterium]